MTTNQRKFNFQHKIKTHKTTRLVFLPDFFWGFACFRRPGAVLEDFCDICEGSEDNEGPGPVLGVGTEGEGEVESLVTVAILSDEVEATAADVHRMIGHVR